MNSFQKQKKAGGETFHPSTRSSSLGSEPGQFALNSTQQISFVMAKGYWISTGTIHTPLAMVPYISRLTDWLPTVGAKFLIRDVNCDVREGSPGSLNVIIEFPSLEAAVSAYESTDYQSMIALRTPHSDLTLTISEELVA